MIGLSRGLSVFGYTEPCDMRKSFNTLSALVEQEMGRSVLTGDLFLFVSRDRKRAKVLYFDGTGLCLFAKRLEKGKFSPLWNRKKPGGIEMTPSELALFIEGSESVGRLEPEGTVPEGTRERSVVLWFEAVESPEDSGHEWDREEGEGPDRRGCRRYRDLEAALWARRPVCGRTDAPPGVSSGSAGPQDGPAGVRQVGRSRGDRDRRGGDRGGGREGR